VANGTAGRIEIGFTSGALYKSLPSILQVARARLPQARIGLHEMSTNEQITALGRGDIDLGILHSPIPAGIGLSHRKIAEYGLVAAVPQSYPLRNSEITIAQMAREGMVLFTDGQGIPTRSQIARAFELAGAELAVVQEANRALTVLSCVAAGAGVALIPEWIRSLSFEGVCYCSIRKPNAFPRVGLSLAWKSRKTKPLAARLVTLL
jgi:DNA-binding transcriptional LysR family regulator